MRQNIRQKIRQKIRTVDDAGFFKISGRAKEILITAGMYIMFPPLMRFSQARFLLMRFLLMRLVIWVQSMTRVSLKSPEEQKKF